MAVIVSNVQYARRFFNFSWGVVENFRGCEIINEYNISAFFYLVVLLQIQMCSKK